MDDEETKRSIHRFFQRAGILKKIKVYFIKKLTNTL